MSFVVTGDKVVTFRIQMRFSSVVLANWLNDDNICDLNHFQKFRNDSIGQPARHKVDTKAEQGKTLTQRSYLAVSETKSFIHRTIECPSEKKK